MILFVSWTTISDIQTLSSQSEPFLNGKLPEYSPSDWKATKVATLNIDSGRVTRIKKIPGTSQYVALDKFGKVLVFEGNPISSETRIVLDLTDRMATESEAGLTGVAFHPDFNVSGSEGYRLVFLFYTMKHKPELIYDRLSKFRFSPNLDSIRRDSEEILIQQADRDINHNAGDMFFDGEGYLYLSIGDEGKFNNWYGNGQKINKRLFSGILRIDVDEDLTRSHPIRRYPAQIFEIPQSDPQDINQSYTIPDDNPWVDESGENLEEFYAMGLRNPFTMYFDSVENEIWVGDVGDDIREEINIIEKGDNAQWAYMEGNVRKITQDAPDEIIGNEKPPVYEYGRDKGHAVIGGMLYRGENYPDLNEKYLFGDWELGNIWELDPDSENPVNILLRGVQKVTGFFMGYDEMIYFFDILGNIYRLDRSAIVESIPEKLSDLGVFTDLKTLEFSEFMLPYEINSPLWSDGATKRRWIVLPTDSLIGYHPSTSWTFPSGTVFVKHFEKEISADSVKNLETRFFVMDRQNVGYGITYKWNEDDSDAILVGDQEELMDTLHYELQNTDQVWNYPTRSQCMRCHNENAGYVLGLKTAQLNMTLENQGGVVFNQIENWKNRGLFENDVEGEMLKMHGIEDTSASLESRVRSYLDANCSHCHYGDGLTGAFDARFSTPLWQQGLIDNPTISFNSESGSLIVNPQDPDGSELWLRDASLGNNKMPPLAKNVLDESYLSVLEEWIKNLEVLGVQEFPLRIFPNPIRDYSFSVVSTTRLTRIEVFDIMGKPVPVSINLLNEKMADGRFHQSVSKGVYFLTTWSADKVYKARIILAAED